MFQTLHFQQRIKRIILIYHAARRCISLMPQAATNEIEWLHSAFVFIRCTFRCIVHCALYKFVIFEIFVVEESIRNFSKVNNLLNSGSIVGLLQKIMMHNTIFPDTAYSFYGFAGFDGRTVQPIIVQPRVANAHPATQIMIDTYMAALGFEKAADEGRFTNGEYDVWDLLPRNVLTDNEGDIFVVDAEIKHIAVKPLI